MSKDWQEILDKQRIWPQVKDYMTEADIRSDIQIHNPNVPYYQRHSIEPIQVINDWGLNFNMGSVIKYIGRYRYKGSPLEDLKKAKNYLQFEIDKYERQDESD